MTKLRWMRRAERSFSRHADGLLAVLKHRSAPRLMALGDRARDDGAWVEAARHYRAARRLDPNNVGLIVQLGHALKESGDLVAAEQVYRDAITLRPLNADSWLMLGHCLKQQARTADALDAYARAQHLDPWAEDPAREILAMGAAERMGAFATINNSRLQRLVADLAETRDAIDHLARNLPSLTAFASFAPQNYDLYRKVHRLPQPPVADARLILSLDLESWSGLGLRRCLASLAHQSFADWRLSIHGGTSTLRDIATLAATADPRISIDSKPDPAAWQMSIPVDVVLDDSALAWFAWTIANTAAAVVYCDDDCVDAQASHSSPHLRGMFDPIAAVGNPDYLGPLIARRTDRAANADDVHAHIPLPLASRLSPGAGPDRWSDAPVDRPAAAAAMGISVIIPTRDRIDLLEPCVESLMATARPNADLEIIVIDNGTTDGATAAYLRAAEARKAFRVLSIDEPFNWARLNNIAARQAQKPLLLFLNNDTECLTDGWDRVLSEMFADPAIGAVGARLLYDDHTIQHAGILFGSEHLAMHDGHHVARTTAGPEDRWSRRRAASAVTGACLATPRALFESLAGFDERRFAISYNDVDYCLRVRAAGRLVAYEPRLTLFHHESKSRGVDHIDPAKQQRDREEARLLRERWGDALDLEPSASPHWARFAPPFTAMVMPSLDRIIDHIRRSARPNPWLIEPTDRISA